MTRITVAPASSTPSFRAMVGVRAGGVHQDVRLIWMGQRRVPGVEAGVTLRFEGMLSRVDGTATVYNPRYEIIGRTDEH